VTSTTDDRELLAVLHDAATAVRAALDAVPDWGLSGAIAGQHHSDLAADAAALDVLHAAGLAVLSEESGRTGGPADVVVVLDPLDGSTNAHRGIPWFATSLCAVDAAGPRAAVVVDQARGTRFDAVRGGGARRDREPIRASACSDMRDAVVGLSGLPATSFGWRQYRALGAAALDLCAVACGVLDAYVDCSVDAHGSWDYLGGALVCQEAGALVGDAFGRDLAVVDHGARRTPIAAATPALYAQVEAARASIGTAP
jgi:fructose-1,6-bisphosphatase/inositol monophosphatase family enzyme